MEIKALVNKIYSSGTPIGEDKDVTEKRMLVNKYSFWIAFICFFMSLMYIPMGYWQSMRTTMQIGLPSLIIFILPFITKSISVIKTSFILIITSLISVSACIVGQENHLQYALIIIFILTVFLENRGEISFPIVAFASPIIAYIILEGTNYSLVEKEIYTIEQAFWVKHIVFFSVFMMSAALVYFFKESLAKKLEVIKNQKNDLENAVETRTKEISDNQTELTRMFVEVSMKNKRLAELQEKLAITQREQQKFVDIVENSLDLIALTRIDGSLLYINKAGKKMIGIADKEEFKSSRPWDITSDAYRHQLVDTVIPYIAEHGDWQGEIQLKNQKTNNIIDTDATFFILRDKQTKKSISVATIQRDITEKKQAENKMKLMQSSLVQSDKMASLGVISAGIAHEINNPINFVYAGVNTLIELVQDMKNIVTKYENIRSPEDNNSLKELFTDVDILSQNIRDGALRTIEIIKSLKVFARTDTDKLQTANVNMLINAVLIILKPSLQNIKIIKDFDAKMRAIQCYAGELNQVFMNIIANAIQAMNRKGELIIKTRYLDNYIKIYIKDTGTGMSEEVRGKVFEPFFTTKNIGDGLGLGMSISYGVIEKHNGNIRIKSEVGKGSEFIITLPV